jgi:hypothetical protein
VELTGSEKHSSLMKYGINEGKSAASFLPPGGSMGFRYVLQLLLSEKSQNCP